MTDLAEWQGRVGRKWADEWRRTDRSFGGLTDRLLGQVSSRPFTNALDVGCGAGEISLALARGHTGSEIRGVDVSSELVEIACQRGERLANVSFECADVASWHPDRGFVPDLLVSRHGVMFFNDPVAAFRHLATIASDDARLVFSCFRDLSENPWADRVIDLLPAGWSQPPSSLEPGPFAFADQVQVRGILSEAGWTEILFEPVDYAFIAGAGEAPAEDALSYFLAIGPAARAAAELSEDERANFVGRLRRFLGKNVDRNLVAFRASAWIISAHKR